MIMTSPDDPDVISVDVKEGFPGCAIPLTVQAKAKGLFAKRQALNLSCGSGFTLKKQQNLQRWIRLQNLPSDRNAVIS